MAKERKVVYSLEVVEGQGNKQAVDNTIAGLNATTTATKAATAALNEHTAAAREASKPLTRAAVAAGGGAGAASGGSLAAFEAEHKLSLAAKQAAIDEYQERKRGIRETERAGQVAEREAKKRIAENQKIYSGYVQIAGGVTQAARAAVLFGATNEENEKQMLRMVLVGEGIVSTFSAVKGVAQGLTKVLGGAAGGTYAIAGLAGGAAAAALAASATSSYAARAVKENRPLVNGKYVNDAFLAGTDGIGLTDVAGDIKRARKKELERKDRTDDTRARQLQITEDHEQSLNSLFLEKGRYSAASAYAKKFNANWREDLPHGSFDPIVGSQREHRAAMGDIGVRRAAAVGAFESQSHIATQARWRFESMDATASPQEQSVALKAMKDAIEQQKSLHLEIAEIDREAGRENLRAADERLSKLRNERGERLAMLREAQGERRGGAVAFMEKSAAERALLLDSVKKAQSGNFLGITDVQSKLLDSMGGIGPSIAEERANVMAGKQPGFNDIIKPFLYRNEGQLAKGVTDVTAKISNEMNIKVQFEANERDLAAGFLRAIQPYRDQLTDVFAKVAEMASHQLKADDARKMRESQE